MDFKSKPTHRKTQMTTDKASMTPKGDFKRQRSAIIYKSQT